MTLPTVRPASGTEGADLVIPLVRRDRLADWQPAVPYDELDRKFTDNPDIRDWDSTAGSGNDDSAAFAGAAACGYQVRVPPGVYNCDTAACTTHVSGSGLIGGALSKVRQAEDDAGVTIIWNGSGPWWQMAKASPLSGAAGGHLFRNITFRATHADGILFDWPSDATNILRNVTYEGCVFLGPDNGDIRTAIAIRGYCLFELRTDSQCFFYGFARAIELDSCDNLDIDGKFQTNTQHIRLSATEANFGNGRVIRGKLISTAGDGFSADTAAHIVNLGGNDLALDKTWFENSRGNGFIYHDAKSLIGDCVLFNSNSGTAAITLGPSGLDAVLVAPWFKDGGASYPIVSEAWAQQSTSSGAPYTLTMIAPNQVWSERGDITGARGRVRVVLPARPENHNLNSQNLQIGSRGIGAQRFTLTPNDLQFASIPSSGGGVVEADSNTHSGLRWTLSKDDPYAVVRLRLYVGRHVQNGDTILLHIRSAAAGTISSGSLRYAILKNGSNVTNGALVAGTTSYATDAVAYTLSGFSAGDSMDVGVYTAAASVDQDCYLEGLEVVVLPSVHSDTVAPGALANAAATLTWGYAAPVQILSTPLTANRSISLSTNGATPGASFLFIRDTAATGLFDLRIGTGPLSSLGVNQWCRVTWDGSAWKLASFGSLTDRFTATALTDAAKTYTWGSDAPILELDVALTANRTITLTATNAPEGATLKVVRTANSTGAFNLNVGSGPLKALATGTWCEVYVNGGAWKLLQYGAL